MNKLKLSPEEILYVLEDIQAVCAVRSDCVGCLFHIPEEGCSLAHLQERWQIDDLIRKGGDPDAAG